MVLGHPLSLPGHSGSEDRDFFALHHKFLFRHSSLPQFPCCSLSFPRHTAASAAVNAEWGPAPGAGMYSAPHTGDTVIIIIIDFPVYFMFRRVFCWK